MHAQNYGVYGVRKVHAEVNRLGHPVARCTVARLMTAAGLRGISRAKAPRTTIPGHGTDTRPDLVQRAFTAAAPDQLWVVLVRRDVVNAPCRLPDLRRNRCVRDVRAR